MPDKEKGMEVLRAARALDPSVMTILFTGKSEELPQLQKEVYETNAFDIVDRGAENIDALAALNFKARTALLFRARTRETERLGRHFSPQLIEGIRRDTSQLQLARQTVTVVFWDIRGFSKLCGQLQARPDVIAQFLKEYFEVGAQIIAKHDGVLDKFIGDGVMALFGVCPFSPRPDDGAADAVHAALEFNARFNQYAPRWLETFDRAVNVPEPFESPKLGCGINTEEALVGLVGTPSRDQFTALGPAVNLASRLEGEAQDHRIIISKTTYLRVKDRFVTHELLVKEKGFKNIPGPIRLFWVEQEIEPPPRNRKKHAQPHAD
jgi:class 3 adenylate cyclase